MNVSSEYRIRRWLGWAVLVGPYLLMTFHRTSMAVLSEQVVAAFDTTAVELGTLHAAFFYLYAVGQLPAGVLADRYGPKQTTVLGTVVMSVGAVGFGLAGSYLEAVGARLLVGLGGSLLYVPILRYTANWFRAREFASMTGLTVAASALGGMLATTPLAIAVSTVGWRESLFGLATVGFVLAIAAHRLVVDAPARAGLTPKERTPDARSTTARTIKRNATRVLRDKTTWVVGLMTFCAFGVHFTVFGLWVVPYLVDIYGLSVSRASTLVLVANVGLLVGSVGLGALSDRIGRRNDVTLVAGVLFTAAFAVPALLATPPLVVLVASFFAAMFLLGGFSLAYTVVKERHPDDASGTAIGLVNGLGYAGAAVFPAAMGGVLDAFWTGQTVAGTRVYSLLGYRLAFAIATAGGAIAVGCALWVKYRSTV